MQVNFEPSDHPHQSPEQARSQGGTLHAYAIAALLLLAAAVGAIWSTRWFVTQDGPAHLYNAKIILNSLSPDSPYSRAYRVQWKPLPNWSGHVLAMGLLKILPPRVAERAITTLTLVGLAAAIIVIRIRVAGKSGLGIAALLAVLLALNFNWLVGFVSFEIGSCLYALTLADWWGWRNRPGPWGAGRLIVLLILGYFCHPVSWGLTIVAILVLNLMTPLDRRRATTIWTIIGLSPAVPLGLLYSGLMRGGGPLAPTWGHFDDPFSFESWSSQLGWVDPISLASKLIVPFQGGTRSDFGPLFAPVLWLLFTLPILVTASWLVRVRERRAWLILGVLFALGGVLAPDSMGARHGEFLPQRIILLGFITLVPWFKVGGGRRLTLLIGLPLVVASLLQILMLWDYALACGRFGQEFSQAEPALGKRQRIATLLVEIGTPFRANHYIHFDCLFGIETGNIIWSNYEPSHYYFPVQPVGSGPLPDLERISILASGDPRSIDAGETAALWSRLLERDHSQFDRLLIWGRDEELDSITARWFDPNPVFVKGKTRVLVSRRRSLEPDPDRISGPRP